MGKNRPFARANWGHVKTIARKLNRGSEQIGKGQATKTGVQIPPAACQTGRGDRIGVAFGDFLIWEGSHMIGGQRHRRAPGAIISQRGLIGGQQHGKAVTAQPGRHRFHHTKHCIRRNRGINGGSAACEHRHGGSGSTRMSGGDGFGRAFEGGRDGGFGHGGVTSLCRRFSLGNLTYKFKKVCNLYF